MDACCCNFIAQRICSTVKSIEGKQPEWVARWLDLGKPRELIELQRSTAFKNDVPRVIRPDILLTENGFSITELDSVPGGIGLTGWLNQTYTKAGALVLGGADGMIRGFESIFGDAKQVQIVVSEEAKTYRPEMEWLAGQIGNSKFKIQNSKFEDFAEGDAVYRFFELFDLPNIANAKKIFELAVEKKIRLTPPPKPMFEEKMLFALLWNRNLHNFWRQELGEGFLKILKRIIPYTWLVDPTPMPPHAAIPELNLTDWSQLKAMSQKERDLILKVSGFSENAWGARGVYLGSDLSSADWSAAVDAALANFESSPSVLQRFHKPALVEASWFDFAKNELVPMKGRARLCPVLFCDRRWRQSAFRTGRRAGHNRARRQKNRSRHDGRNPRAPARFEILPMDVPFRTSTSSRPSHGSRCYWVRQWP